MKNIDPLEPIESDPIKKFYEAFPPEENEKFMRETAREAEEIIRNEPNPDLSDI